MGLLAAGLLLAGTATAQHALRFNSADDDMVMVPTTGTPIGTGSFTYEAWVYYAAPQLLGGYNTIFELGSDERAVFLYGDSSLTIYGGSSQVYTPHHVIRPQRWTHIAVSYDDATSTTKAYINGTLVMTETVSFPTSSATELGIGHHAGDTGWQGEIDEVQIWSTPRTAAQIGADMWGHVLGTAPGLVAYYKFDEGQGQVTINQKPGGVAGQLGNDPAADQQDPTWTNSNPVATPAEIVIATGLTIAPNPSAGQAVVRYELAHPTTVGLTVVDAIGREVATLVQAEQPAGAYAIPLTATHLPAGVYTCRLTTPTGSLTRRLVLTP